MTTVAKVSELEDGDTVEFTYQGEPAILIKYQGKLYAYRNLCPHEGGPSRLVGNKIVCDWHFSEFEPESGKTIGGPAEPGTGLKPIALKIENDRVVAGGS